MFPTIPISQFRSLFCDDISLLDIRAPVEFQKGAFPLASNIPILNDEQRRMVGTKYQSAGAKAATELGHSLLAHGIRETLISEWCQWYESHRPAALYCFRGGQRSQIAQQWLHETGCDIPRIEGGYKALRQFLLASLDESENRVGFIIAGGKTGSAKTHLINQLQFSVDLEGRAHHRGSAFGPRIQPQPAQIDFENSLAINLIKLPLDQLKQVFFEDESHSIGSVHLPKNLYRKMQQSPLAIIESPFEARVDTIFSDYILSNYDDFLRTSPSKAETLFSEFLKNSLEKIKKRLGPDTYQLISTLMDSALKQQFTDGKSEKHRDWIETLLTDYYDPMYDYQLSKKHHRIVFRGNGSEFIQWANSINQESK